MHITQNAVFENTNNDDNTDKKTPTNRQSPNECGGEQNENKNKIRAEVKRKYTHTEKCVTS